MVTAQHQVHNPNLFVIGFMGDIQVDSGLETLVKAVESIKEFIVDMQLIVLGDGDQKKNVAWLTKMLGLDDRIRFVGKQQNWMRWYNYFDIFVCPRQSKTEFSFETAYALAHGVPYYCFITGWGRRDLRLPIRLHHRTRRQPRPRPSYS
jgi:glycosyltransferase involved in cell wall biosynthesis